MSRLDGLMLPSTSMKRDPICWQGRRTNNGVTCKYEVTSRINLNNLEVMYLNKKRVWKCWTGLEMLAICPHKSQCTYNIFCQGVLRSLHDCLAVNCLGNEQVGDHVRCSLRFSLYGGEWGWGGYVDGTTTLIKWKGMHKRSNLRYNLNWIFLVGLDHFSRIIISSLKNRFYTQSAKTHKLDKK